VYSRKDSTLNASYKDKLSFRLPNNFMQFYNKPFCVLGVKNACFYSRYVKSFL